MLKLYNRFHPILGELMWLILHHRKAFDTDFMVSHQAFRVISHQQHNNPINQEESVWQCQSWLNSLFRLQLHFTPATRRACDGVGVIRSRPFPVGWTTVCVFLQCGCVCGTGMCTGFVLGRNFFKSVQRLCVRAHISFYSSKGVLSKWSLT